VRSMIKSAAIFWTWPFWIKMGRNWSIVLALIASNACSTIDRMIHCFLLLLWLLISIRWLLYSIREKSISRHFSLSLRPKCSSHLH
jgi:hypothetical protein